MTTQTKMRNAELEDLAALLRDQHATKVDMVAPATSIFSKRGLVRVKGVDPVLSDDGVTLTDGEYRPTRVFDEGLAGKLGVPLQYLRRLRDERPDLLDANVNGLLHGRQVRVQGESNWQYQPDDRNFLVRAFKSDDGPGIARAFLSDSFKIVDNLDCLTAALDGVKAAGVEVNVAGCDLTERKMQVRLVAPEVQALAPALLRGYRSPFTGDSGDENPTVFAGLVISNSETGNGAYSITPRLIVQVCNNGMTVAKDAVRSVHLGSTLDEGVIRWSDETEDMNLQLIRSKTADAVKSFLDVEYMRRVIDAAEEKAGERIEKPHEDVKVMAKKLRFTEAQTDGILDHFVRGGQMTKGGVMHAVSSFASTVEDPDEAAELESQVLRVLDTSV